jgi:hypothetical protein
MKTEMTKAQAQAKAQAMFGMDKVKKGANLTTIGKLAKQDVNLNTKRFDNALVLADEVFKAYTWYQSEGKALFLAEGLKLTLKEFAALAYDGILSIPYFLRLVAVAKAVNASPQLVDEYKEAGEELSLLGFLAYVKDDKFEDGDGDGDGDGESESKASKKIIATFKSETATLKVRENGTIETDCEDFTILVSQLEEMLKIAKAMAPKG